jgi:lipoprotein-releasing system ATP-binding protein
MTEALVEVRELTKDYQLEGHRIEVLRGIDLDIHEGEQLSIIGPSGSGKSTFLHVMGTLDRPSQGRVRIAGQDVGRLGPGPLAAFRNRTIGFVFQFHHLLPEFSAIENVAMPALIHRLPQAEAERRATRILDSVGLGHRLHHRPGELSGGEQQRVSIARALIMQPKLLLADEPTGNLDERSADGIHELLQRMNRELGLTVVLVTHRSELAQRMPRRLVMHAGRLTPAG